MTVSALFFKKKNGVGEIGWFDFFIKNCSPVFSPPPLKVFCEEKAEWLSPVDSP